jgi:hypothetical protein
MKIRYAGSSRSTVICGFGLRLSHARATVDARERRLTSLPKLSHSMPRIRSKTVLGARPGTQGP